MDDLLTRMTALVERHADPDRYDTIIPGVAIHVGRTRTVPTHTLYQPMLCFVLQGAKQVMIGDQILRYDPASYFIASLDLPATGCIIEASPERPYVAMSMAIDRELLAEIIADMPLRCESAAPAFATSAVSRQLLDPFARMLGLLDAPEDVPILAPLIRREIFYRVLQGAQGGSLCQIARADSRLSQVRRAIGWIREHYQEPLRIEALAAMAGMSAASFHRYFKVATAMSPLQYQKLLRLQQARRLLVANPDAQRAAFSVGYESPSQFSREYARLFGCPPARDAERLRRDESMLPGAAAA